MKILTIASLALRRLLRDRTGLFFTLMFPVLIIFLVGFAIFDANAGAAVDRGKVGVLSSGDGLLAANLVDRLEKLKSVEIRSYRDLDALRRDLRRETVDSGVVIPSDYDDLLRSGKSAEVRFLFPVVDPAVAIQTLVNEVVADQGAEIKAALLTTSVAGGDFEQHFASVGDLPDPPGREVKVEREEIGRKVERTVPLGFRYPAASNLILFVFITSLAGSSQLIQSRQLGVSKRMLGTPTSSRTILLGESLGRFVIAGFQGIFIFLVGTLIFRVQWGNSFAAAVLILMFALVGTSVGIMSGTLFRTPEQAGAVGPPLGIAFGMLGGCMWPLEIVPSAMRSFGHITPHAWAMDAWIDLIGRGRGIQAILGELGVLAAFVIVLLPLATIRLRRALVSG